MTTDLCTFAKTVIGYLLDYVLHWLKIIRLR